MKHLRKNFTTSIERADLLPRFPQLDAGSCADSVDSSPDSLMPIYLMSYSPLPSHLHIVLSSDLLPSVFCLKFRMEQSSNSCALHGLGDQSSASHLGGPSSIVGQVVWNRTAAGFLRELLFPVSILIQRMLQIHQSS